MHVFTVFDEEFRPYGKVLEGLPLGNILEILRTQTFCPQTGVTYVPSVPLLEAEPLFAAMGQLFGTMPVQLGYCNGNNHALTCLEYHRGSELNLASEDIILLLAQQKDITDDLTLDSAHVKAFLVPAGTPVLIYETSLHYAPVSGSADGVFHCLIGLPKGTNEALPTDFAATDPESRLLWARNKWLLARPDAPEASQGAYVGLFGDPIHL